MVVVAKMLILSLPARLSSISLPALSLKGFLRLIVCLMYKRNNAPSNPESFLYFFFSCKIVFSEIAVPFQMQ